ncbi:hypothetical protein LZ31DRAFT_544520 [Colletotrichum somersetense]|nr:hypothetical protein LZ31DRAFT_544520 [Colletotrichum somersetense]
MVQVGNKGDVGTRKITEMLFSVRVVTAGAILMEWNVAAAEQGAAAMWDSHFRVGGALGTDLDLSKCLKFSIKAHVSESVYMGYIQTESPYYQPNPGPPAPFRAAARAGFPNDPDFSNLYGYRFQGLIVSTLCGLGLKSGPPPRDYVTSLEYGGFSSTTIGVIATTIFVTATTTVTISVPAITTDAVPFSNVNLTSSGAIPIIIYPSIDVPDATDRISHRYRRTTATLHGVASLRYNHPLGSEDRRTKSDDGSVLVPCTAWFFFFCTSWGETHVRSWHWILPPGIYGPMPPPIYIIQPPPGINIVGNLPNWPKITIGNDHQLTTESEPECNTQKAEACTTTSSTPRLHQVRVLGPRVGPSSDEASAAGSILSSPPGATAGPICGGESTACGGTICSGYWCNPNPTNAPPGYQDLKDPSSGGYAAPTTTIGPGTTTTQPPTTPPTDQTPLARGPVNCFNETNFPNHGDIQFGDQDDFFTAFSNLRGDMGDDDTLGPGDAAIKLRRADSHGVNYDYSCSWVPGCVT